MLRNLSLSLALEPLRGGSLRVRGTSSYWREAQVKVQGCILEGRGGNRRCCAPPLKIKSLNGLKRRGASGGVIPSAVYLVSVDVRLRVRAARLATGAVLSSLLTAVVALLTDAAVFLVVRRVFFATLGLALVSASAGGALLVSFATAWLRLRFCPPLTGDDVFTNSSVEEAEVLLVLAVAARPASKALVALEVGSISFPETRKEECALTLKACFNMA